VRRHCAICARPFEAKTNAARYCGSTCRNRKARGSAPIAETVAELPARTREQLDAVGRLNSVLGQQALRLAEQICVETGSSLAALNRELRATMAEALDGVPAAADPLDELKARREARRAG
jgi:hypothetical protein